MSLDIHAIRRLELDSHPVLAGLFARTVAPPQAPQGDLVDVRRASAAVEFELPPALEADAPPEARGLARDEVRLLVSHYGDDRLTHARFRDLDAHLEPGDLLVINTSGTLSAAVPAGRADGSLLELHLSTRFPSGLWVIELRRLEARGTKPLLTAKAGERLSLPGGATASLIAPYRLDPDGVIGATRPEAVWRQRAALEPEGPVRLWVASFDQPITAAWLERHGQPIRYGYVRQPWPAGYYQTVYATEPGSAEMPSAGRAFTPELITRLVAKGVQVAPVLLHTGVASLEDHEPPYEEYFRVPEATARRVNAARADGCRVVAVGTTVVRALETVARPDGRVSAGSGWTRLVISPARGVRVVDGLLTGLHEPKATHLAMLSALSGVSHLKQVYGEALRERYLWHEFGDLHLLLP